MSSEQNKATVLRVIHEAYNQGDLRVIAEVFAPDFAERQFGLRSGIAGMQADVANLRRMFPDLTLTVEDAVAVDDRVWLRATARGTNTGGFMGPPNGITVFDELRFEGGKIVEHWGSPDRFALLAQLGLLPAAEGVLRGGGQARAAE